VNPELPATYQLPCYAVRDGALWVAVCLPLGIPSQSPSLQEAIDLLGECVAETITNLGSRGLDPLKSWTSSPESVKQYNELSASARVQIDVNAVPESIVGVVFDLKLVSGKVEQQGLGQVTAPLAMAS
jgi:hypothetical protein